MSTPRFDLVGIVVTDMARALEFYRQFGLEFPPDAESQPHVEAAMPGGVRLAWDTYESVKAFDPEFPKPSGGSGIGLAFRLDTPGEVDATYHRLVAAGFDGHKAPWDAFWGQRYALIHDPDGNNVDLFASLPPAGSAT